jgi:pyruvate-formate lyase-activating enzyme
LHRICPQRPLIVAFYLGTACNLRCSYCAAIRRQASMSEAVLRQGIAEVAALREQILAVPFGGEPLVMWGRTRILVEEGRNAGFAGFLPCTNGIGLDAARLAWLEDHRAELTWSWGGPDDHGRTDRQAGNGAEAERILGLLASARRIRHQVRVTLTPANAGSLGSIVQTVLGFLGTGVGVKICFLPAINLAWQAEDLDQIETGVLAAAEALGACLAAGGQVALALNECIPAHELGEPLLFQDETGDQTCGWGADLLAIDADGALLPCHTALELDDASRRRLCLGHLDRGVPNQEERRRLYPRVPGVPWHACLAWNQGVYGDPYVFAPAQRKAWQAAVAGSLVLIDRLRPERAAEAHQRAAVLRTRCLEWEAELATRPRPPLARASADPR